MSENSSGTSPTGVAATPAATPSWVRPVIFGGSALALLLIGATIGLLIGRAMLIDDGARARPGDVDIGFSQDMSVHHSQAVEMGELARARSSELVIRQLGHDIATTQLGQIGAMQGWLTLWEQPDQAPGELMTWMHDDGHGDAHQPAAEQDVPMPGMATEGELRKLRSLAGEEFDVFFLQLMLRHHEGGIPMAEYAAEHARVFAVRTMAAGMVESQNSEIVVMRRMLAERDAEPLPFG